MQHIIKTAEPEKLREYKRHHPTHRYDDLKDDPEQIRLAIRQHCLEEQSYLCAYCCRAIGEKDHDCMNEHVKPRHKYPQYSLDMNNIIASCTTKGCCDDAKDNDEIAITPLSERCKNEFKFNLSGTINAVTPDAKETVKVLKLGDSLQQNQKLVDMRRQAISSFLFTQSIDPDEPVDIEDDELLKLLIEELKDAPNGRLTPFAPVIINALKTWIDGNKL